MTKRTVPEKPQNAKVSGNQRPSQPGNTARTTPPSTTSSSAQRVGSTPASARTTVRPQPNQQRKPNQRKMQSNSNLMTVLGIGGLLIVVVGVLFLLQRGADTAVDPNAPIDGLKTYSNLTRNHVETDVTYAQNPPAGGDHSSVWLNCGVYDTVQKNGQAVHALEHGAIWVTYNPDLPSDQVDKLRSWTRQTSYRLLSPYDGLPAPIVATAWGYQIYLDSPDDPRLEQFAKKFEQNPNGPEPGAACSGGVGSPIQ